MITEIGSMFSVVQVSASGVIANDSETFWLDIFWVLGKNTSHTAKSNAAIYHTLQTMAGLGCSYTDNMYVTFLWHTYFVRKFLHYCIHTVSAVPRVGKAPNFGLYWASKCLKSAQTITVLHMWGWFSDNADDYDLRGPDQNCLPLWVNTRNSTPGRDRLFLRQHVHTKSQIHLGSGPTSMELLYLAAKLRTTRGWRVSQHPLHAVMAWCIPLRSIYEYLNHIITEYSGYHLTNECSPSGLQRQDVWGNNPCLIQKSY